MQFDLPGAPQIGGLIRGKEQVTSSSYHESGEHLFVVSEADSRLHVVDCLKGTSSSNYPWGIKCEMEGINTVESTHHKQCVLFAGKGSQDQPLAQRSAVNYLSLHDNKILRKFRGHADMVSNISMSPKDDCFLSSSLDRTVRLWNLQHAGNIATMELPKETQGAPIGVFDSTGLVFGIMAKSNEHLIHLYDARNYSSGPFSEFKVPQANIEEAIQKNSPNITPERAAALSKADWASLAFNMKGDKLLVTSVSKNQGVAFVLDGFEGTMLNAYCSEGAGNQGVNQNVGKPRPMAACFTPDDETVLCGNENGSISCWNAEQGTLIKKLEGHSERISCIAFNPKYAQLASSSIDTALWIW